MNTIKHWQDPLNAVIGVCVAVSPWVLGVEADQNITTNFLAVGILLLAAALGATFVPRAWEEWVEVALGVWLVASPWVIGFAQSANPTAFAVAVGIVIVALASWVLMTDRDYRIGSNKLTVH